MNETPEQTAARLARDRGYAYPEWEYLAERDPVFLEALEAALIPVGSPPFRQAVNILMQVTGWKPAAER